MDYFSKLQKLINIYHIVKTHEALYSWVNGEIVHQYLNSLFVFLELHITFTLVHSHYSPQTGNNVKTRNTNMRGKHNGEQSIKLSLIFTSSFYTFILFSEMKHVAIKEDCLQRQGMQRSI